MSKALYGAVAIGAMIVALGWGASTVSAQDSVAVVKDRQATMKAQGAAMGGVKKYLDGAADQAAGTKSAEDLVAISTSLAGKFPKGTGNAEVPSSNAKPIIWTDGDKFAAAQKSLIDHAQKLVAAVKSGDKQAAAEEYAATGKDGCGACHGTFRLPLN
ncbi:MAG TPA: cytochrome c [Stellaceae bacterium]|jgi:cytochrome c556|nr:cytochrome c [Stellaceae bacterium]